MYDFNWRYGWFNKTITVRQVYQKSGTIYVCCKANNPIWGMACCFYPDMDIYFYHVVNMANRILERICNHIDILLCSWRSTSHSYLYVDYCFSMDNF